MASEAPAGGRPGGATALAVLFALLGVLATLEGVLSGTDLARAVLAGDTEGPRTVQPALAAILGLACGIGALAFARGLWGLKPWALRAYAVWLVSLGLLTLVYLSQIPLAASPVASTFDLAFGVFALAIVLAMPWVYTAKLLRARP